MKINKLNIRNFKSIRNMEINDIENVLILVGKNNTGKTIVLDALRLLNGNYNVTDLDFNESMANIEIEVDLQITNEDLKILCENNIVTNYNRFDLWFNEFCLKLPSYNSEKESISFCLSINTKGVFRFSDGYKKDNPYISQIIPHFYYIDTMRHFEEIQEDIFICHENEWISRLRDERCIFDYGRKCNRCFKCIGMIENKSVSELNVLETARLFEYKLYKGNLNTFSDKVNKFFKRNGGVGEEIHYHMAENISNSCKINGYMYNNDRHTEMPLSKMGTGMRCIYILSLLEAYIQSGKRLSSIILMEDPEIFLHPRLQKEASEILYRLSKTNQVIFTTHSPNMLFNFTSGQIRQILLDSSYYSIAQKPKDIDKILDDLGYTANDLMNVSFIFIVEGRQDKNRLPLLLNKYYSEINTPNGKPSRIAIITTNSCTNIKTYANLKYINKLYIKDQFLMIRDGDGKDPEELAQGLCHYYEQSIYNDIDKMPKVTRRNVLILKYYSFENYFLDPVIMSKIGVIPNEEYFYQTLFEKWTEYLYKIKSCIHFKEITGINISCPDDIKNNLENIKIYVRGHNLYDIFYGKYKKDEKSILQSYIDIAPRDNFKDILDAIDNFIYFENRAIDDSDN